MSMEFGKEIHFCCQWMKKVCVGTISIRAVNVQFCRAHQLIAGPFNDCGTILTAISSYSLVSVLPTVCIFSCEIILPGCNFKLSTFTFTFNWRTIDLNGSTPTSGLQQNVQIYFELLEKYSFVVNNRRFKSNVFSSCNAYHQSGFF